MLTSLSLLIYLLLAKLTILSSPWHKAIHTLKPVLIVVQKQATEIAKLPVPSCLTPNSKLKLVYQNKFSWSIGKIGVAQSFSFTVLASVILYCRVLISVVLCGPLLSSVYLCCPMLASVIIC